MNEIITQEKRDKLYNTVLILSVITVFYNVAEGLLATYFGIKDETLTLFGFGADSFIETFSAIGITQMVIRIKRNPYSNKGPFEISALKITGFCFYALAAILLLSSMYSIFQGHRPTSAVPGIIIGTISIFTMWTLVYAKISIGKKLDSSPVISDAKCNLVCVYMSIVLLLSSGLWWLFKIPHIDAFGAFAIVYFSIKEGREAFQKAKGIECCSC